MSTEAGDGEQTARSVALELAYVHDVYEQCAERTVQGKPWPKIHEFLEGLEPGALVCDVGCGNGKYLNVNHNIFTIGIDRSESFTHMAREKENQILRCDNLSLPFRDENFDAVLSIAVIHHFSTTERRVRALRELARILRIGGRMVISVWAMEQKYRKFESQDVLVPWPRAHFSGSPIKTRKMSFDEPYPDKNLHAYYLSKRSKNLHKTYWVDPITSPSPSASSLSSPNETCYSFFRRALQKLAGGRRSSRAWFLESYENARNGYMDDYDLNEIPIELRRLEEPSKSKSLGNIPEAESCQQKFLVRSRSSVHSLCSQAQLQKSAKPRLVKQKNTFLCEESLDNNTAAADNIVKAALTHSSNVYKQSSMNEELMSCERLKEREKVRSNITKQTSWNEDYTYKGKTLDSLKETLYSGSATKKFQLIKSGLTNKLRQSTSSMEKVSGTAIKNTFVRMLQSWKATAVQSTTAATPTTTSPHVNTDVTFKYPQVRRDSDFWITERRHSREDGSDSSKDGSFQSDTSVDSEESFASVIYVPNANKTSPKSTPTSPKVMKFPTDATMSESQRLKLMAISPLFKQFLPASQVATKPTEQMNEFRKEPDKSLEKLFAANKIQTSGCKLAATDSQVPLKIDDVVPLLDKPISDENKPKLSETAITDEEECRQRRLNQIKEILKRKPEFASRTRPPYPLVRPASTTKLETAPKAVPKLLSLELFNPETDDLDSDSSGVSSPESEITVVSEEKVADNPAKEDKNTGEEDEKKAAKEKTLDTLVSPVESTWNEECRLQLQKLTEKLSLSIDADEDAPGSTSPWGKKKSRTDGEYSELDSNSDSSTEHRSIQQGNSVESSDMGDSIENTISDASSIQTSETCSSLNSSRKYRAESTASLTSSNSVGLKSRKTYRQAQRSLSEEVRTLSASSSQESLPSDPGQPSAIAYHQYYHVFRQGELDQLIDKYVDNLHVISSYYDHASWCVVAEKVQVWTI